MSDKITLAISKLQRGPYLKLSLSTTTLNYPSNVQKESEHFEVNDLACIKFRVIEENSKHAISMSMLMKHESSKNSFVRMNVKSETLNYSKQFYYPGNDWAEWVLLGKSNTMSISHKISYQHNSEFKIYSSLVDVDIFVCKEESETYTKLYLDPDLSDFQLTTADGSVAVHRACLAVRSDYFKRMFTGKWKEAVEGKLDLKDVNGQNLQDLKDAIYLGTLPEPDERLRQLIVLAKRFLIDDLIAVCAKKLAETVLSENLFSLHELACLNNIPELSSAIAELTPDAVISAAYLLKTNLNKDAAPKNVKKE